MTPSPSDARATEPRIGRAGSALAAAPERLVLVGVSLSLAAGIAVTASLHHWWTVLPLALGIAVVAWRPLAPAPSTTIAEARGAAVAVIGTAAWTLLGFALAAEYLLVVRDPGFLTLSGLWLVDHASTDIPAAGAVEAAAAGAQSLPDASEAWNLRGDVIQPQGAKMLPATIAIGGWVAGDTGVLAANVVVGAIGILAVYAAARRFLGPYAALAPAGALALTVSHIGLSRPAYTEPLTLVLVIAGLLWAWRGIEQRSLALLAAGGLASGATMLVRIDGTAFAIGACAGVLAAVVLAGPAGGWRARAAAAFVLPQALLVGVGYVSLQVWSREYIDRLGERSTALNLAYVALALVTVLIGLATASAAGERLVARLRSAMGGRAAVGVGTAVAALLTVLASRPLWTVARRGTESDGDTFANGVVESFQAAQGLPIDATRTYAESTMSWLAYYLTWPLVVLAVVGFGIAAVRALRGSGGWAIALGAVLAPSLLYLVRPSIIPDQIWAIRRFEPATLPGFLLAAALGGWALAALASRERTRAVLRAVTGAAMVGLPLTTWIAVTPDQPTPVSSAVNVTTREMIGARDMIQDLCALSPGRPIVLVGTSELYGGLRVMCDVPVVLALSTQSAENLAGMAAAWDESPLVLTRGEDSVPWTGEAGIVVDASVRHSSYTLGGIPRSYYERDYRWRAGVVDADGRVEPLGVR
ncbi:hypothetical protein [Demequina activiva]|uniref:Glycosyltransferase RgtA/B/C/D-like domain-containing protein n=1 Tax=Demequina activiva TaxID=1582364 RepID=A0A919UKK8_9MICO|nr:hypothetical protein [Demequina activiva]GIG55376.1 hypothetical protein Dac01nite_21280 [Demequina activiva]